MVATIVVWPRSTEVASSPPWQPTRATATRPTRLALLRIALLTEACDELFRGGLKAQLWLLASDSPSGLPDWTGVRIGVQHLPRTEVDRDLAQGLVLRWRSGHRDVKSDLVHYPDGTFSRFEVSLEVLDESFVGD